MAFRAKNHTIGPSNGQSVNLGLSPWSGMRLDCIGGNSSLRCDMGLELQFLTILAHMLNVSFEIKLSNGIGCGYQDNNGTWTGLLGMLYRREIDIIGNLCSLDETRMTLKWLRTSYPILNFRQAFVIRIPEIHPMFEINAPFETDVWIWFGTIVFVFAVVFALTYRFTDYGYSLKKSFHQTLTDVIDIFSGSGCQEETGVWFLLVCFFGLMGTFYSTFIFGVFMQPVSRPFSNNWELADALSDGRYKLLDYTNPPRRFFCSHNETCETIQSAIRKYDFEFFEQPHTIDATNLMFSQLLSKPHLVFMKGSYQLLVDLNSFRDRFHLWFIRDELSSEQWSIYFYSNHTALDSLNNKIALMGDAKHNVKTRYLGLSSQIFKEKFLYPTRTKNLTLKFIGGPSTLYIVGVSFSVAVLLFEKCKYSFMIRKRYRIS